MLRTMRGPFVCAWTRHDRHLREHSAYLRTRASRSMASALETHRPGALDRVGAVRLLYSFPRAALLDLGRGGFHRNQGRRDRDCDDWQRYCDVGRTPSELAAPAQPSDLRRHLHIDLSDRNALERLHRARHRAKALRRDRAQLDRAGDDADHHPDQFLQCRRTRLVRRRRSRSRPLLPEDHHQSFDHLVGARHIIQHRRYRALWTGDDGDRYARDGLAQPGPDHGRRRSQDCRCVEAERRRDIGGRAQANCHAGLYGRSKPPARHPRRCAARHRARRGSADRHERLSSRQADGGDAELYAAVATVQTVVSFFTIPLVLAATGYVAAG